MVDDEEVAILMLNLNGTGEGTANTSPQDGLSSPTDDLAIIEGGGNDRTDHNFNHNENGNYPMEKDFEFVRKHAANADPDFLHSLLNSQSDNPKRLETVMSDMLNIPNALELIQEFRRNGSQVGSKRAINDMTPEPGENKKKKNSEKGDTETYLQQIRDMFPDADGLFLISECQQLESWEDYSRFVNTVMINGVYPKKGAAEYTPKSETPKVIDIVNDNEYRTVVSFSSEEEISSSGLPESPRGLRRRRKKRTSSNGSPPFANGNGSVNGHLHPPDVEVVDIASDNTESYDPPDPEALQEIYQNNDLGSNVMEVDDTNLVGLADWQNNFSDEIDNLLFTKFGPPLRELKEAGDLDTPKAGPSGLNTPNFHHRLSLPGEASSDRNDSFVAEKSLAEIIEERRQVRRRSLDSRISNVFGGVKDFQKPSTSAGTPHKSELYRILHSSSDEVSSPEVSSTFQSNGRKDSENLEMAEEADETYEQWLDEQCANLMRIFPNTDPSYLRGEAAKMKGSSEAVNEFVISKLERNDMPTRAEYEKRLEMEQLQNRYTKNFSIEDFLKAVPDPWTYFSQGNRNCAKYKNHSLCYLKSTFKKHYIRDITVAFAKNKYNLYVTYQHLKKLGEKMRGRRRSDFECNHSRPTTIDIQFLQEVAFIENEEKIKDHLEGEKIARQLKFDEAKRTGSLLECQCCFDTEVMVEDVVYCPKDHSFCKECIVKSVEVEMGNGRCEFACLANCEEKFTLSSLQNVLKPELFSKVIQANQMEEIRAAGIEDLVQCPFCNYATIMPPEEKVMTCLNPECLKESCRLCKELNHIPLRCDEVEKSEDVKMRTYIENKMTEALVRTCYKCSKKFVKEDGCNKMTCTCGAQMCYVCRKPVSNYSHFNGLGGTEYHKCPLYSTNDELHVDLVKRIGEEAKAKILQENPQAKLMYDPTAIMPERTHEDPLPGMNNGAALNAGLRAIRGIINPEEQGDEDPHCEVHRRPRDNPRRGARHEHNIYYNRYHRHRHRTANDSDDDDDNHNHNHAHQHAHHHRHQPEVQEHPHHHHHHHHRVHRHHHV